LNTAYSFPPSLRLLRPAEFKAVFDSAAFKIGESQFLLLVRPNALNHPRLGLVIAKKKVRRSVDRNRLKRHIRESFRQHQAALPATDIIFMARQDIVTLPTDVFRLAMEQAWKRLLRKAEKSGHLNQSSGAENTP
jgi:ribonuclease P protein component